ncbi:N-acetyltransferase [Galactobacter valiniphilus]|uniref:N-acetyltransferase n=1 Tax=Galactobacter valiniphilus TaxID=2676122 RepID=A0A399JGQ6_9MICC|nr:GNAT family N-acetyltransferase [Galactobacter valiniphilus]RII43362.1 N-acetyltransferase [Galactobacter valiniphilus]
MSQTPLIAHEKLRVLLDAEQGRFSLFDGEEYIGFLGYVEEDGVLDLQHTIIKEEFSRHGYARALVTIVLERVWALDKRVIPTCSYVAQYLDRFSQYQWLVAGQDDDGAAPQGRHAA